MKALEGSSYIENVPILTYTLDFADVEQKIDLEIDGNQHYSMASQIKSDVLRNQTMSGLGWKVIRVNWVPLQN